MDDDESVRESLPDLLKEFGFTVAAFASAEEFLGSSIMEQTRCLLLDIAMPGMTGLELQDELIRQERPISIIFITSRIDDAVRLAVLERGAIACLFKPFTEEALLGALKGAVPLV